MSGDLLVRHSPANAGLVIRPTLRFMIFMCFTVKKKSAYRVPLSRTLFHRGIRKLAVRPS